MFSSIITEQCNVCSDRPDATICEPIKLPGDIGAIADLPPDSDTE